MKTKTIKRKRTMGIRVTPAMWREIQAAADKKNMRPSEFVRRVLENQLLQIAEKN